MCRSVQGCWNGIGDAATPISKLETKNFFWHCFKYLERRQMFMRRRHMLGTRHLTICGYPTTQQERRVMRKSTWRQISCKHCLAMHAQDNGQHTAGRGVPA